MGQNMFQVATSSSRKDPSTNSTATRIPDPHLHQSVTSANGNPDPILNGLRVDITITPPAPDALLPFPSSQESYSYWDSASSTTSSPRSSIDYDLGYDSELDVNLVLDPQFTDDWVECFVIRKEVLSCAVGKIVKVKNLKVPVPVSAHAPMAHQ